MAKGKVVNSSDSSRKIRSPLTPEAEENQMISLAVDRAKQQLLDGTASSQVIVHFLKLGTAKERLEREKLENEVSLLKARTESLESMQRMEEIYKDALSAMQNYSGHGSPDND